MNTDGTPYIRKTTFFVTPDRLAVLRKYGEQGLTTEEALAKFNTAEKVKLDEEEQEKEAYLVRNAEAWKKITFFRNEEARCKAVSDKYGHAAHVAHWELEVKEIIFREKRLREAHEARAKRKRDEIEDTALENATPR